MRTCAHMHAGRHARNACTSADIRTHAHMCVHMCTHKCIVHASMCAHVHAHVHAHREKFTYACMNIRVQSRHICMHAYMHVHVCMHVYVHMHMHTRAYIPCFESRTNGTISFLNGLLKIICFDKVKGGGSISRG